MNALSSKTRNFAPKLSSVRRSPLKGKQLYSVRHHLPTQTRSPVSVTPHQHQLVAGSGGSRAGVTAVSSDPVTVGRRTDPSLHNRFNYTGIPTEPIRLQKPGRFRLNEAHGSVPNRRSVALLPFLVLIRIRLRELLQCDVQMRRYLPVRLHRLLPATGAEQVLNSLSPLLSPFPPSVVLQSPGRLEKYSSNFPSDRDCRV